MITFKKAKCKGFKKERWFILIDGSARDEAVSGNVVEVNRRDGTSQMVTLHNMIEVDTEFQHSLWTFTKVAEVPEPREVSEPVTGMVGVQVGNGAGGGLKLKTSEGERKALDGLRSEAWVRQNIRKGVMLDDSDARAMAQRLELIIGHCHGNDDEPIGCYRPLIAQIEEDIARIEVNNNLLPDLPPYDLNNHRMVIALLQDRLNRLGA